MAKRYLLDLPPSLQIELTLALKELDALSGKSIHADTKVGLIADLNAAHHFTEIGKFLRMLQNNLTRIEEQNKFFTQMAAEKVFSIGSYRPPIPAVNGDDIAQTIVATLTGPDSTMTFSFKSVVEMQVINNQQTQSLITGMTAIRQQLETYGRQRSRTPWIIMAIILIVQILIRFTY